MIREIIDGHRDFEKNCVKFCNAHVFADELNVDGLVQDCSKSSALAMELLPPCTKPSMWAELVGKTSAHTEMVTFKYSKCAGSTLGGATKSCISQHIFHQSCYDWLINNKMTKADVHYDQAPVQTDKQEKRTDTCKLKMGSLNHFILSVYTHPYSSSFKTQDI